MDFPFPWARVFHLAAARGLGASLLSPALLGTAPPPDPSASHSPAFHLLMGAREPICRGTYGRKGKKPRAGPGAWPMVILAQDALTCGGFKGRG